MMNRIRTTIPNRDLRVEEGEMLLVRKPKGMTSFDVVRMIRRILAVRKVGHAGTLDPMATGLLIICTGRKTKEIGQYVGLEKEYHAQMVLGARTASFDADTAILERRSTDDITEAELRRIFPEFVGYQTQRPPIYSAVKVRGRRLYTYARKGQEIERRPREIFIKSIIPTDIYIPIVTFTVVCSKGTYVRSLVADIGTRLGCGAYLSALERTRIGEFHLAQALTLDDIVQYAMTQRKNTG